MQSSKDLIVEPIGVEVETLPHPISWPNLFGNDHPVELEIGIGKGTFLTDAAKRYRVDTEKVQKAVADEFVAKGDRKTKAKGKPKSRKTAE